MKLLRNIIILIVIAALAVGVYILAGNAENTSVASSDSIIINEFMASNGGSLVDDNGGSSDWIEIYNPTDSDINLSGYALSDDETSVKWAFPSVSLKAGGYLVVFASGDNVSDADAAYLHTNFKLSASGGGIYLMSKAGQVVGEVTYDEQAQDVSLGRDPDDLGSWLPFNQPTPGFENTEAGYEAFLQSRVVDDADLMITEVMSANRTTVLDENGAYSDYIEIYNAGQEAVSLLGYGLSDNADNLMKWTFPDVTITPGEYLLVFASGDSTAGELHADFRIASYQETLYLSTMSGLVMDEVGVSEVEADFAYARVLGEDGVYQDTWEQTGQPTPGYSNDDAGRAAFEAANQLALGAVVISEVMTRNAEYLEEADGECYDWIELVNTGSEAVDITGYSLTDDSANPAKWRFPETVLQPGKYIVVLASGLGDIEGDDVKKNYIHTSFKLNAEGEVLTLYDSGGNLLDKFIIGSLPRGISIGRASANLAISYFEQPTPAAANATPSAGVVATPVADIAPGSYDDAQQVTLACDTEGAGIYYTLDGTEPTRNSKQYTGAITMSDTGMVRARAFADGYIDSTVSTSTYFIGETHDLPLISLVTDPDNLWNNETGIYVLGPDPELIEGSTTHYQKANYLWGGKESERPASFEVFDESGTQVFTQDIAIRIQGGFSRDNQQKSFSIIARTKYGASTMKYAFFDELPFTEYSALVLKNGGQDQWYAKIKGPVIQSLTRGNINCLVQTYKPYVVYLNGEYWGVYFLQEKRNEDFVAQHENVDDANDINVLAGSGMSSGSNFVMSGTNEGYKDLMTYAKSHDMSQQENFDYVAERLDTDSFMDLMINQIYIANSDYYNLQFYQVPGGKWKQIFYDFCWAFREPEHPTLVARMDPQHGGSDMFNALLAYKPWKKAFVQRFAETMENIYTVDNFISVIDEVEALVAAEIPAEREKFTDTTKNWEKRVEGLRTFAKKRPANVLSQLKSVFSLSGQELRGYFSLSDEQLKSAFNLSDSQMQSIFG